MVVEITSVVVAVGFKSVVEEKVVVDVVVVVDAVGFIETDTLSFRSGGGSTNSFPRLSVSSSLGEIKLGDLKAVLLIRLTFMARSLPPADPDGCTLLMLDLGLGAVVVLRLLGITNSFVADLDEDVDDRLVLGVTLVVVLNNGFFVVVFGKGLLVDVLPKGRLDDGLLVATVFTDGTLVVTKIFLGLSVVDVEVIVVVSSDEAVVDVNGIEEVTMSAPLATPNLLFKIVKGTW